jgi:hypothetical protein
VTVWTYLTLSFAWSLVGWLIGFLMGRSTVAVDAIADDVVQGEGDAVPEAKQPARRRWSMNHAIGAVVLALGIFTAVQAIIQSDATDRLAECQIAYSNGFADALDARSQATSEAQDALDELLTTVAAITPTPEGRDAFRSALSEYLSKRAAAKQAQAENPYPPAPRDVCKEAS